uniref:ATP-dependent Clp protease proteolytic subunit n=1 Tax=Hovenia acerba TaxID=210357 RepID=A0A890CFW7_9ROSA|nr:ATP-dependent Clp protease proteolytic subunit [Hovenia acerba]
MHRGLTYSATCQICVEPYASKGACTVPKGYNFIPINRLYRERLLFLGQPVDNEISNQLIGLMVYLSIEDDTKDLYLFINSPGGWLIPGVAIYDTMQFVRPDIQTVCMGLAASMGSFILVGGEITKRLAFPHAWRQCKVKKGKSEFHCRAVCNAQKMPVRLFNSIFFFVLYYFIILYLFDFHHAR